MDLYNRLCLSSTNGDWQEFSSILTNEEVALKDMTGKTDRNIVAKMAEVLTRKDSEVPLRVKMLILKYLMISTLFHEPVEVTIIKPELVDDYCNKFYERLSVDGGVLKNDESLPEYLFLYEGVGNWAADYLAAHSSENEPEQLIYVSRCLNFLCNIICITSDSRLPRFIFNKNLKSTISTLLSSINENNLRLVSALIHNIICTGRKSYFDETEFTPVLSELIRANMIGINASYDAAMSMLRFTPKLLDIAYNDLPIEYKLHLLEMIYQNLKDNVYKLDNKTEYIPEAGIVFLIDRFKKRSDLILKTEKSYVDGIEPTEVTILLDILGLLSLKERDDSLILQADTSLLINATFLLRALHAAGKEADNNFTPLQKLSDVAPSGQSSKIHEIESHPAFGFKAALIRLIGNLVHRHKKNQDTVRDTDGISLLLDCCNIDARNPLIIQWTILAVRNLCEKNPENQKFIHDSHKVKFIDTTLLQEMGLTLNEDENGKAIGVVPLPRSF